jgi:hypothetical protein
VKRHISLNGIIQSELARVYPPRIRFVFVV